MNLSMSDLSNSSEANSTFHYDNQMGDIHAFAKQQFQAIFNFLRFVIEKRNIPLEQQSVILNEFIG